jgi:uncharacterized protein YbbC (DUF1343 family)
MKRLCCRSGLDRLFEGAGRDYRGARVGLIANPASVDSRFRHAVDRFAACTSFRLTALFGPQHGIQAEMQDNMIESEDSIDERLGIPVYSLYGRHRKPTAEMLRNVDVLFCDLFDVGCRAYTFAWTAALALEACAESGRKFVVLDRPNPIGGLAVEGNVLDPAFRSFIGLHPIPMRHGLTFGELMTLLNREFAIGADLEVIEVQDWRREQWLDETGLPWVMPSPNMATLATATVYPGTVLVEGTNLSEGRGTTHPFELIGAPFVDAYTFAQRLNAFGLPGVWFRPVWFRPVFDKWKDERCGGVQVHVTDRRCFRPVSAGFVILRGALELYPRAFRWREPPFEYEYAKLPIDILAGSDLIRRLAEAQADPGAGEAAWRAGLEAYQAVRSRYLRYQD